MRQYQTVEKQTTEAIRIVCDCCGKEIKKEKEDYLEIEKTWGYFSEKDGDKHQFDICEHCYDVWVGGFVYPPTQKI